MKILVVGGGGREHAIIRALSASAKKPEIYCAPGNGGIAALATCVPIGADDITGIAEFAAREKFELVVVAPDDPLAAGLVDMLEERGIRAFGPRKNAAIIESSKAFSKELMLRNNIPTADYRVFSDYAAASEYITRRNAPLVIKADGLALGKGVIVAETAETALKAAKDMLDNNIFGKSGSKIVVEERMTGPEVTVLCFTDGKTIAPMPSSQDHKRAYDGDKGPNTGGMGAICPSPHYTPEIADICMERIFKPTIDALNRDGRTFKGVIYFGLMLTEDGPKVVEYNARFGDPECQAVLARLDTDLLDILEAVTDERLGDIDIRWKDRASCCVVMASGGYPGSYEKGFEISGLDNLPDGVFVYHAGTRPRGDKYVTNGGRVLGVTATGDTLRAAIANAYAGVERIYFKNEHHRSDIGRI